MNPGPTRDNRYERFSDSDVVDHARADAKLGAAVTRSDDVAAATTSAACSDSRVQQCSGNAGQAGSRWLLAGTDRRADGCEHEESPRTVPEERQSGHSGDRRRHSISHHGRGCCRPVHRPTPQRHDGNCEVAGRRLHISARGVGRALSFDTGTPAAAESGSDLRRRSGDSSAERRDDDARHTSGADRDKGERHDRNYIRRRQRSAAEGNVRYEDGKAHRR
jgi:hypothetical protein